MVVAGRQGMTVEVVYATPERQELVEVGLAPGATVADAIAASGIAARFPDEPVSEAPAGIWGRPVGRSQPLEDGDRVELYRPLVKDPRDARRERAAAGLAMGSSAGVKDPD